MHKDSGDAFRPCRLCGDADFSEAAMRETLDEYLSALPEEDWAAEVEYAKRLSCCASCEHQRQGTCVLCGCYVRARAAKWRMSCPMLPPCWERSHPGPAGEQNE